MNIQSNHKWWSTLKSAVFDSSSSLPLLVTEGGGLVCESVGKADLLTDHFDNKQSKDAVDLPLTCYSSTSLTTFAFRSSDVRRFLLDLDSYGGTDPWVYFIFLYNLWNAVVCFQPPTLLIEKVWVPVMHFCACPMHCRVHWRVGRRLGSCRLTLVQPFIGSSIWAISISYALWVLEVLSCLY